MKKFEPHYRLVRVGMAAKKEQASRQQRKWPDTRQCRAIQSACADKLVNRQAAQEQVEGVPWCGQGQGWRGEEGQEIDVMYMGWDAVAVAVEQETHGLHPDGWSLCTLRRYLGTDRHERWIMRGCLHSIAALFQTSYVYGDVCYEVCMTQMLTLFHAVLCCV